MVVTSEDIMGTFHILQMIWYHCYVHLIISTFFKELEFAQCLLPDCMCHSYIHPRMEQVPVECWPCSHCSGHFRFSQELEGTLALWS